MFDLLCLGNVTIDDVVLADGTERPGCLGGDAIYAGLAARLWSPAVAMVAPVGNDFPATQLASIAAVGLDTAGLPRRPVPTRHNRVTYHGDGGRDWKVLSPPGDFALLSPVTTDIPSSSLETRFALILAMDLAAQEDLASGLRARGVPVALDPQEDYIAGNEARILRMLGNIDVFLPSEIEVERLLGHRDIEKAARRFAQEGCVVVAIKLGAHGVVVYDAASDSFRRWPPAPAKIVDTTGAGDSFSGGFIASYARHRDLDAALQAGLVSSAFAIEDFGATALFEVTHDMATARLARLPAAIQPNPGAII